MLMITQRLVLPYPPSANRYWRNFRGRMVPSAEATAYKAHIWAVARSEGLGAPSVAPMAMELILRPVRPKDWEKRLKREGPLWWLGVRCVDADNALKVALDAIQGIAYENDRQIVALTISKGDPVDGGGLEITWREWRSATA